MPSPFEEMLSILRQHEKGQLEMNRNLISVAPGGEGARTE